MVHNDTAGFFHSPCPSNERIRQSSYGSGENLAHKRKSIMPIADILRRDQDEDLYEKSSHILGRLSGNSSHIRAVSRLVEGIPDKYEDKYTIKVKICDSDTPPSVLRDFFNKNICCALIYDGKPHQSLIVKWAEKIIVFSINRNAFIVYFPFIDPKNLYCLDPEIFTKPANEPVQDAEKIHYQADDVSCGLFVVKMIKELLNNNAETLKLTIFDEENHFAYPHPKVFKQSQSNIFLDYYAIRFVNKCFEHAPNKTDVDSPETQLRSISSDLRSYRTEHFGKARIFHYSMKYFEHVLEAYMDLRKK